MERVKIGIPGMDDILKTGVLSDTSILVTGGPGSGKSIFALQFIYAGAKNNIPGLYITSEQSAPSFRVTASSLGFDLEDFEKRGLITIIEQAVTSGKMLSLEAPLNIIRKKKIRRVVLDSLTLFEFVYQRGMEFKKGIISFLKQMKEAGVTTLVTAERDVIDMDTFLYRAEDYLFDGMIILTKIRKGSSFERVVHVAKMRGQDHSIDIYPFVIAKGGIKVMTKELPFSLIEQDVLKGKK
ncbi:MAG: ATPase domain-containing protein [archaeon]